MTAAPAPGDARVKEALLESLAVSRGGALTRTITLFAGAIPIVILLREPLLLPWLAALIAWNALAVRPLERHWVIPAIDSDLYTARLRRASMVLFGLSLTTVLPLVAWSQASVFGATVAVAWALSSATQVFVYYSRDRMLLAAGILPICLGALVGPILAYRGPAWEGAAGTLIILIALAAGAAFVGRSDKLIALAASETAARHTAEAANSAKSRFIANVHHELRTPLNAIIGYSEMLRETAVEEQRDADVADLDRVLAAARQQLMMIGDLLAFTELQDGRLELEVHNFDAAPMAREAANALRAEIETNSNTLTLDIAGNLSGVRTDPAKLRHCLEHLLSNAGKFTRNGAVTLRVRREADESADWLIFTVEDTGIGIAPNRQQLIFEPFTLGDDSATRTTDGAGLGLAITSRIARQLGGGVSVRSVLGRGSIFTLRVRADLTAPDQTGAYKAPVAAVA